MYKDRIMAGRKTPLVTGEYYHVFNRGVAKQPIFFDKRDYQQAVLGFTFYHFAKPPLRLSRFKQLSREQKEDFMTKLSKDNSVLVKIISYCLMPNHFHLLLQQVIDGGIAIFLSRFSNSYTKYQNTKTHRVGPLLSGTFKFVHVEDDEQLIHLSRYIHLNPVVSYVIKDEELLLYPWSSLSAYLKGDSSLVDCKPVLSLFKSAEDYKEFVLDQIDYGKKLEGIKHLTLE